MIRAKKKYGQHFLKNETIAEKIVEALDYNIAETVIEVGPGTGVLTKYLLNKPLKLFAVEIDEEAAAYLLAKHPQLNLIKEDFLKLDRGHFGNKVAIIGNFPYNISSQILFKALSAREQVTELVGMFQKEVAKRITGEPGNKDYGILSVLVQAFYEAEYLFEVGRGNFVPPPKVESAVIRLRKRSTPAVVQHEELFFKVVKKAFNQRRKMLSNSLKDFLDKNAQSELLHKRPEQLSVKEFVELTNFIAQYGKTKGTDH